jgi:hypothetical protein
MPTAEWKVYGPGLNSFEIIEQGQNTGSLTVDYCSNADTRWDFCTLAPGSTAVDLAAAGGTVANANAIVSSGGMHATPKVFVFRGTRWAKLNASNLTLISDGTETNLAERATGAVRIKGASGTEYIAVGMAATAYHVIKTADGTNNDTDDANNASVINRLMFEGPSSGAVGTVMGLGVTSSVENTVRQSHMSGSLNLDTAVWVTNATFSGEDVTFTGFGLDPVDNVPIVGTNRGPYYLHEKFRNFVRLLPGLAKDADHCKNMGVWAEAGPALVVPLARALRYIRGRTTRSFGPEKFRLNTSPFQGRCSAWCASDRWGYFAFRNPITSQTWIGACEPRQAGAWFSDQVNEFSWYPLFTLGNIECETAFNLGTEGGRTFATQIFGYADDILYIQEGRVARFPDDTSYEYAASGTCYLTEMRRKPEAMKRVTGAWIRCANITSTETVTVKISVDGQTAVQLGGTINSATHTKWQRLDVRAPIEGVYLKPQFDLARGVTTTLAPRVHDFHLEWEERPW